jgi:hypothetical protein
LKNFSVKSRIFPKFRQRYKAFRYLINTTFKKQNE